MTKFVGTSLRGFGFSSPSDEAVSARVNNDSVPRIRIDAGGRITWGSGSAAGDVNLYRDEENVLTTDDLFVATGGLVTITSNGAPNYNVPDGGLAVDATNDIFYFRSNGVWNQVSGGNASVIIQPNPPTGEDEGTLWLDTDTLILSIYYDSEWVEVSGSGGLVSGDVDGGNLLPEIYEAEVTNYVIVGFDGGVL